MRDVDNWINDIIRDFFGEVYTGGAIKTNRNIGRRYYDKSDNVVEDDKRIYITFELRVGDDDFEVIAREDVIIIYLITTNEQIVYKLPNKIEPKSMAYTHNNYVLDIVLEKKGELENDDERV